MINAGEDSESDEEELNPPETATTSSAAAAAAEENWRSSCSSGSSKEAESAAEAPIQEAGSSNEASQETKYLTPQLVDLSFESSVVVDGPLK